MLSVHEVTTAYQGLVAISAVSIEVAKGEIVCVAGANGAGKSTLLKSIAGAERPRSGTVTFDGARIDGMAQHLITARGIAYVPENRRLFPRLSVRDNLRLGSYLYRGEADREEPLELVFKLFPRLSERLEQRAETLSGGEQQMLAIGRALMTRPRLLMLDEPSQGIMPKLVDEIFAGGEAHPRRRHDRADRRAAHGRMPRHRRPRLHPADRPRADAGRGGGDQGQSGRAQGVSGAVSSYPGRDAALSVIRSAVTARRARMARIAALRVACTRGYDDQCSSCSGNASPNVFVRSATCAGDR